VRIGASSIRQSVRVLVRRPLYSGGVIATLGLGLGSAGAVFAVAWAVWIQPLPFPDPERIVRVYEVNLRPDPNADAVVASSADVPPARWNGLSPPFLTDLQKADLGTISAAAAVSSAGFDWLREGDIRRLSAQLVSPELFEVLNIRPLHGRLPMRDRGAREVVLLEPFWQRSFGANPEVVGSGTMVLDGEAYAIVGIIEQPAGFPAAADLWAPLIFEAGALSEGMRGARYLDVIARVRPGRSVADGAAEIDAFLRNLADAHPNHQQWGAHAVALKEDMVRPFRSILLVLLGAGSVFLSLATVNVSGLVAARRADTRRARAIRIALGASHQQILREGLTESALLGVAGAVTAVAGVFWVLAPIKQLIPADVPRLTEIGVGPGLVAGLLCAGIVGGLFVGLLGHALSGVGRIQIARSRDAGQPSVRGRRFLLATQIALTTWLLIGGTALMQHILSLRAVDSGFQPERVRASFLSLSPQRHGASEERSLLFWEDLLGALEARGITAAVGTNPPISGSSMRFGYAIQGDASQYWGQYHAVTSRYFAVLGASISTGRPFNEGDRAGSAPVVIVNETLARQHFPNVDPVGRTIQVVGETRTIVGVARSIRHFGPDQEPPPELYVPLAQKPSPFAHVLLAAGPAGQDPAADALTDIVADIDPYLLAPPLQPFGNYVKEWFAPLRLQMIVLSVFAMVGSLLAALGIYALVAYIVSNGLREIGIRLALGERSQTVFRRVLAHGVLLTGIGIACGTAAAFITRRGVLQLAQVDAIAPSAVLIVGAFVAIIAVLASVVPARRAISVDPMVTLRGD
jgi:putative ABC transport system permease protein